MRGDAIVNRQRLMAQAVSALANHLEQSTGYAFTPVKFADLPPGPQTGYVGCINDYNGPTPSWGQIVAVGGGTESCLVWYNGTNWTIIGK